MATIAKCANCKKLGRYAKSFESKVCAKCEALKPTEPKKHE